MSAGSAIDQIQIRLAASRPAEIDVLVSRSDADDCPFKINTLHADATRWNKIYPMPMNANVKSTAKKAALLAARWHRRGVAARGTNGTEIRINARQPLDESSLHFSPTVDGQTDTFEYSNIARFLSSRGMPQ